MKIIFKVTPNPTDDISDIFNKYESAVLEFSKLYVLSSLIKEKKVKTNFMNDLGYNILLQKKYLNQNNESLLFQKYEGPTLNLELTLEKYFPNIFDLEKKALSCIKSKFSENYQGFFEVHFSNNKDSIVAYNTFLFKGIRNEN